MLLASPLRESVGVFWGRLPRVASSRFPPRLLLPGATIYDSFGVLSLCCLPQAAMIATESKRKRGTPFDTVGHSLKVIIETVPSPSIFLHDQWASSRAFQLRNGNVVLVE